MRIQLAIVLICLCCVSLPGITRAADSLEIIAPRAGQVLQRTAYDPREAHPHAATPEGRGYADLAVEFRSAHPPAGEVRVRVSPLAMDAVVFEQSLAASAIEGGLWRLTARVPAGGWYRLSITGKFGNQSATASVQPWGVGEVFLIAGQSYATNTNEERLTVADPTGRVSAWDFRDGTWKTAHDPLPAPDGSDGGSIWPPLGDHLVALLQVPVGLANVAWGGTSTAQWAPGGELHQRLVSAGQSLGKFRAVLWQQGESDVIGGTTTAQYVANLCAIRQAADAVWNPSPSWLLAKSTLHPTVYHDPDGEGRIRHAIDQLVTLPGFAPGPDTDLLDGDRRGPLESRRHFTGLGQRQAALMWFQAIWTQLQQSRL